VLWIAPAELVSKFMEFLSDDSQLAFLITMRGPNNDKKLVHLATLPRSASDFFDDLEQLQPYVKNREPLFVLLRRHYHGRGPPLVGVMYTPDDGEVWARTTFSGTCTSLYRDLGEEHFSKKYQLHSASDLTPSGFHAREKYDAEPPPLTEKEKELNAVKRQEAETHTGTRGRPVASGSGPKLNITDAAAIEALEKFARGGISFFMLVGSLWHPNIYSYIHIYAYFAHLSFVVKAN
jgi:hypothetical protein